MNCISVAAVSHLAGDGRMHSLTHILSQGNQYHQGTRAGYEFQAGLPLPGLSPPPARREAPRP